MKCDFTVGQKVVCVNDKFEGILPDQTLPKIGHVYTIREIQAFDNDDTASILVKEIYNSKYHVPNGRGTVDYIELHFYVWHFKPLDETSTDARNKVVKKTPIFERV